MDTTVAWAVPARRNAPMQEQEILDKGNKGKGRGGEDWGDELNEAGKQIWELTSYCCNSILASVQEIITAGTDGG
ncbi:unnamed protein product [Urochloa humidicola]